MKDFLYRRLVIHDGFQRGGGLQTLCLMALLKVLREIFFSLVDGY